MTTRDVVLALLPEEEQYTRAARSSSERRSSAIQLPLLARSPAELRGFPHGIAWDGRTGTIQLEIGDAPATPGLVLSTSDPICQAAATLLASSTGRRHEVVDADDDWERQLHRVFESDGRGSVTLCVPSWTADRRGSSPTWVKRTLKAVRALRPRIGERPWGILTAPTPATLTQLVAKSVLQAGVVARYADRPGFMFTIDDHSRLPRVLPAYEGQNAPHLYSFDQPSIDDGRARQLADMPAALLLLRAHGRSYCACSGLLCGARDLSAAPESEAKSCVMGLDCPDPKFHRIDPRRYDVPIFVFDTCGAANWGSPVWDTGTPTVAYYALAGSASAVIAGDGITVGLSDNTFDLPWAVLTSPTLGEAAARLNALRPHASGHYPYFVMGDPDIVAGAKRWPEWVEEVVASERADGVLGATLPPSRRPLERVRVPIGAEGLRGHTLFVQPETDPGEVGFAKVYRHAAETEVWLRREPRTEPLRLGLLRQPSFGLPDSIVAAASRAPQVVGSWHPSFGPAIPALVEASRQVMSFSAQLRETVGTATLMDPRELAGMASRVLANWQAAQRACCEHHAQVAGPGMWPPFSLWVADNFETRTVDTACPNCGDSPTRERLYDSPPASARIWSECVRCDITSDRPLVPGFPAVHVEVPFELRSGSEHVVRISVSGSSGQPWLGAGVVMVAGQGHGVVAEPAVFDIHFDGTQPTEQRVQLRLPEPPAVAHLYRVRILTILNGQWHWSSRLTIARR